MSTYTAAKTVRQQRHPASRSESHIKDKQEGEARRRTSWVPVASPEPPSPKRDFAALGLTGHEFILEDNRWRLCQDGEEFADYLVAQARKRSEYMRKTRRHGNPVEVRTRVAAPIKVLTTTFSPWLSEWTFQKLSQGEPVSEKLKLIGNLWMAGALKLLKEYAYLLGFSFHADTSNPHFDLCLSRQDGKGGRIGPPGFGLMGPWVVGVIRQLRAGAKIAPEKRSQCQRSLDNFVRRYGKDASAPLDVHLARNLDIASDEVLGGELEVYRIAYAEQVPQLEKQHAAAKRAALERARLFLVREPPRGRPDDCLEVRSGKMPDLPGIDPLILHRKSPAPFDVFEPTP
jgi:hypothetical protein